MNERTVGPTRILDPSREEDLDAAAGLVRSGEIIAFPTETVYGLAALGLDAAAVVRMYAAKGREERVPLTLMVDSLERALALWREDDEAARAAKKRARALGERFWPGPLTIVSFKRRDIPDVTTGGSDRVGVRIPRHEAALALLRRIDAPIVAPSANPSGALSPTRAAHVERLLGGRIAAILDGGACEVGLESTVVDVSAAPARVLRAGALSLRALSEVIEVTSPGSVPRRAPSPVRLATQGELEAMWSTEDALVMRSSTKTALEAKLGLRVGPLLSLPDDAAGFSSQVYDALFELAARGAAEVGLELVEVGSPGDSSEAAWAPIVARLRERFGSGGTSRR